MVSRIFLSCCRCETGSDLAQSVYARHPKGPALLLHKLSIFSRARIDISFEPFRVKRAERGVREEQELRQNRGLSKTHGISIVKARQPGQA
jgi:hypothetical protein